MTGGGRRIGRALALALAEDGFAVAVHYHRSRKAAEAVVESHPGAGAATALALGADLADEDAVRRLLPQAERAFGPIGVAWSTTPGSSATTPSQRRPGKAGICISRSICGRRSC